MVAPGRAKPRPFRPPLGGGVHAPLSGCRVGGEVSRLSGFLGWGAGGAVWTSKTAEWGLFEQEELGMES